MPQKFAFTTAAMAAALEETPVTYEDLAEIERDFDDAETEISTFCFVPPLWRSEYLVDQLRNTTTITPPLL